MEECTVSNKKTVNVGILGFEGSMGTLVGKVLEDSSGSIVMVMGWDLKNKESMLSFNPVQINYNEIDVIIVFHNDPEAVLKQVDVAVNAQVSLVIATTGMNSIQMEAIKEASKKIAIVCASNYDLQMAQFASNIEYWARLLGDDFSVSIHQIHHDQKMDGPSGTAHMSADRICHARSLPLSSKTCNDAGRNPVLPNQVRMSYQRIGNVSGTHTVTFSNGIVSLHLTHEVHDRMVFARGAVKAAVWAVKAIPGFYTADQAFEI